MPCPAGCPQNIYALMTKCWREEPVDRPTFVELLQQLKEISTTKHASKPQKDIQIATTGGSSLYSQKEAVVYECISHTAEEYIKLTAVQGIQSATVYVQSCFWNKGHQKQHIQVTEEMKSMNSVYFKVFKGVWNNTTPVAVKAYSAPCAISAEFIQQTTIMAQLQHTNILQFFAAFRTHQSIYVVTELIEMNLSTYQAPSIEHKELVHTCCRWDDLCWRTELRSSKFICLQYCDAVIKQFRIKVLMQD